MGPRQRGGGPVTEACGRDACQGPRTSAARCIEHAASTSNLRARRNLQYIASSCSPRNCSARASRGGTRSLASASNCERASPRVRGPPTGRNDPATQLNATAETGGRRGPSRDATHLLLPFRERLWVAREPLLQEHRPRVWRKLARFHWQRPRHRWCEPTARIRGKEVASAKRVTLAGFATSHAAPRQPSRRTRVGTSRIRRTGAGSGRFAPRVQPSAVAREVRALRLRRAPWVPDQRMRRAAHAGNGCNGREQAVGGVE